MDRDEQAAYEMPLAESERRSIRSTIDDAVVIFSGEHGDEGVAFTSQWNTPAHRWITGMRSEAFRGLNPTEFLDEQLGRSVVENSRARVERRAVIEYQEQLVHERVEVIWQTKLDPVIEDDTVVQIIGLARDISDLTERTTHLQVADRVLGHTIRNSLDHIQGRTRQIATQSATPVGDETDQILESADDLLWTAEKARRVTEGILEDPPGTAIDVESLLQ